MLGPAQCLAHRRASFILIAPFTFQSSVPTSSHGVDDVTFGTTKLSTGLLVQWESTRQFLSRRGPPFIVKNHPRVSLPAERAIFLEGRESIVRRKGWFCLAQFPKHCSMTSSR